MRWQWQYPVRLWLNRRRIRSGRDLCGKPGKDYGGVRNTCLLRKGHPSFIRHADLWGSKWRDDRSKDA
jgi:hypothetical protein